MQQEGGKAGRYEGDWVIFLIGFASSGLPVGSSSLPTGERVFAGVDGAVTELEGNSKKLVVFGDAIGELLPGVPVGLGDAVLDAHDRVLRAELLVDPYELVAADGLLVERVFAALLIEEFAGGAVEGEAHVDARLVAGVLDGAR